MRRIQIYIEEETDDALAREAAVRGVSKAALIRECVRRALGSGSVDPIDAIIGAGDGEPVDDIDEVLYGA